MKPRKVFDRRVVLGLGMVCIVLASCLIWAIVVMSSLSSQVSSLDPVLSATPVTVSEIVNNASAWVNKTIMVEGQISTFEPAGWGYWETWNYELTSDGARIGVSNSTMTSYTNQSVLVVGIVTVGGLHGRYRNGTEVQLGSVNYHIEARKIIAFV